MNEKQKKLLCHWVDLENPPTAKQVKIIENAIDWGRLDIENPPFDALSIHTADLWIKQSIAKKNVKEAEVATNIARMFDLPSLRKSQAPKRVEILNKLQEVITLIEGLDD